MKSKVVWVLTVKEFDQMEYEISNQKIYHYRPSLRKGVYLSRKAAKAAIKNPEKEGVQAVKVVGRIYPYNLLLQVDASGNESILGEAQNFQEVD